MRAAKLRAFFTLAYAERSQRVVLVAVARRRIQVRIHVAGEASANKRKTEAFLSAKEKKRKQLELVARCSGDGRRRAFRRGRIFALVRVARDPVARRARALLVLTQLERRLLFNAIENAPRRDLVVVVGVGHRDFDKQKYG